MKTSTIPVPMNPEWVALSLMFYRVEQLVKASVKLTEAVEKHNAQK